MALHPFPRDVHLIEYHIKINLNSMFSVSRLHHFFHTYKISVFIICFLLFLCILFARVNEIHSKHQR